uniref:ARAD1C29458p n=1 Tax=Blastobotrys adeninivorans TaxID=409370 RepID=A0A060T349_BLAAD
MASQRIAHIVRAKRLSKDMTNMAPMTETDLASGENDVYIAYPAPPSSIETHATTMSYDFRLLDMTTPPPSRVSSFASHGSIGRPLTQITIEPNETQPATNGPIEAHVDIQNNNLPQSSASITPLATNGDDRSGRTNTGKGSIGSMNVVGQNTGNKVGEDELECQDLSQRRSQSQSQSHSQMQPQIRSPQGSNEPSSAASNDPSVIENSWAPFDYPLPVANLMDNSGDQQLSPAIDYSAPRMPQYPNSADPSYQSNFRPIATNNCTYSAENHPFQNAPALQPTVRFSTVNPDTPSTPDANPASSSKQWWAMFNCCFPRK